MKPATPSRAFEALSRMFPLTLSRKPITASLSPAGSAPIIGQPRSLRPVRHTTAKRRIAAPEKTPSAPIAEPDPDAQGEQPFLRRADELPERLLHPRRQRQLARADLLQRYGLHGGFSCLDRRFRTRHGSRRDRTRRENRHLKFYELRDNLLLP
jgi:hypothetical protein